jgi:hypothetical protein
MRTKGKLTTDRSEGQGSEVKSAINTMLNAGAIPRGTTLSGCFGGQGARHQARSFRNRRACCEECDETVVILARVNKMRRERTGAD